MNCDIVSFEYRLHCQTTAMSFEGLVNRMMLMVKTIYDMVFFGLLLEPSVRVELMEQVPHVAVYCYEHYSMMEAVPQYILFIVLRFLTDSNNQVL